MDWTSGKVDEARLRVQPYVAMAEMALGHTQSGYARVQASVARVEAQRARLQAVQARWEEQQARIEGANQVMIRVQHLVPNPEQLTDQINSRVFVTPGVRMMTRPVVVKESHRVICPITGTEVTVPEVSTRTMTTVEDPI